MALKLRNLILGLAAAAWLHAGWASEVLVIGHELLPKLAPQTISRLYTGKAVQVDGLPVRVVNVASGMDLRGAFLRAFLNQNEDKYLAYWTVRKFTGQGVPPHEFQTAAEVIQFVVSTPGAIGYIRDADLRPGLNVLSRR